MVTTDTCPDCGRAKFTGFRQKGPVCLAKLDCYRTTIARMRPVVEAAVAWANVGDSPEHDFALVDALETGGFFPKPGAGELGKVVPR